MAEYDDAIITAYSTTDGTYSPVGGALLPPEPAPKVATAFTSSFTLSNNDNGLAYYNNAGTGVDLTVTVDPSVLTDAGWECDVYFDKDSNTKIAAATGTKLNSESTNGYIFRLARVYGAKVTIRVSADGTRAIATADWIARI